MNVYLDESLRQFDIVYPAAGDDHSAVKLSIEELEQISGAEGWVDVCKELKEWTVLRCSPFFVPENIMQQENRCREIV